MIQRPRRLRASSAIRDLVRETRLSKSNLIAPLFVKEGISEKEAVPSMPGIFQFSIKEVVTTAKGLLDKGIRSVLLFGVPKIKDDRASQAYNPDGIIQESVRRIKDACPSMLVITDVCLCGTMDHGHCGVIKKKRDRFVIENDPSLELLAKVAVSQAEAGADMVAPSDMMDGRVRAIRQALDENGYSSTPILSYAVKVASSLYGPFRDAAESKPTFGDRKTYQMDVANIREALREARLDEEEGADILMIKPALSNLDIIKKISEQSNLPIAAYQVSGEYSMIHAAAKNGWLDKREVALETLTAIRRAGAQLIVSYFALDSEVVEAL